MPRTHYDTLVNRGRKAGLGTGELYRALASRAPEAGERPEQGDGNGYISGLAANGRRVYRPMNGPIGNG